MTFRTFVRPLFVALSLAFATTAAAPAFADNASDNSAEHARGKERARGKDKAHERGKAKRRDVKFPIDGAKFQKHVDARIAKAKEKLSNRLDKRGMADAAKSKVLKVFDDNAALVKAAAKRAADDGTVTKEEAKSVRDLVKGLRKNIKDTLPKKPAKADRRAKDV